MPELTKAELARIARSAADMKPWDGAADTIKDLLEHIRALTADRNGWRDVAEIGRDAPSADELLRESLDKACAERDEAREALHAAYVKHNHDVKQAHGRLRVAGEQIKALRSAGAALLEALQRLEAEANSFSSLVAREIVGATNFNVLDHWIRNARNTIADYGKVVAEK